MSKALRGFGVGSLFISIALPALAEYLHLVSSLTSDSINLAKNEIQRNKS
jgi:hypothetical protein